MTPKDVHALAISLDTSLFTHEYGSAMERQLEYAKKLGSYTLIVLNNKQKQPLKSITQKNLKIIPTNSQTRWFYIVDALKIAKNVIQSNTINVLTTQDPLITGLIGVLLKKKYHLPLNIQLHSDYFNNLNWLRQSTQNLFLYPLGILILHQANSLRYDNKRKMKHPFIFNPKLTKKTYQAPMYINYSDFHQTPKLKKDITRLISVGRLEWEKNFPMLITVVAQLIKQGKNISLTIVGGGSLKNKLQHQINQQRVQEKIKITGFLKKNAVKKLLHQNDLFILSSHYEGWAMVTMEALAAGLPVIMTNVGNAGELVVNQKTGLVVPKDNPIALKDAIQYALEHPKKMYQLAKVGQKKVYKNFSKNKLINAWIKCLYETAKIKT